MATDYLFVYGKLRKDNHNPYARFLATTCRFVSHGWIHARLYDIGGYPGAVLSDNPEDRVTGEIYQLDDPWMVFKVLDDFEACSEQNIKPHEYQRRKVKVLLHSGVSHFAYAYLYNRDISILSLIPGGDYVDHLRNSAY